MLLFLRRYEAFNFADNNRLYSIGKNIDNVILDLKTDLAVVMEWFKINSFKDNPDKFQLMVLVNKDKRSFNILINNAKVKNSNEVTLLGIKIDKYLTFKKHISGLSRRAPNKLQTLRIRKCLTVEKAKLLASAFINIQFHYAPLISMFANKSSIDKILKTHKRTLEIVYDIYDDSYVNLLHGVTIFRYIKNTCDTWLLKFLNP